jgi:hypothetical protein
VPSVVDYYLLLLNWVANDGKSVLVSGAFCEMSKQNTLAPLLWTSTIAKAFMPAKVLNCYYFVSNEAWKKTKLLSFFTHILGHLATKNIIKWFGYVPIIIVFVVCSSGHVFDDCPRPTGKRWYNNLVTLNFIASNLAKNNWINKS